MRDRSRQECRSRLTMINGKTQNGSPGSPFPPGVAAQITDPSPGLVWAASLLSGSSIRGTGLFFASRAGRRLAAAASR